MYNIEYFPKKKKINVEFVQKKKVHVLTVTNLEFKSHKNVHKKADKNENHIKKTLNNSGLKLKKIKSKSSKWD